MFLLLVSDFLLFKVFLSLLFLFLKVLSLLLVLLNSGEFPDSGHELLFWSDSLVPFEFFETLDTLVSGGEFLDPLDEVVLVKVELDAFVFYLNFL